MFGKFKSVIEQDGHREKTCVEIWVTTRTSDKQTHAEPLTEGDRYLYLFGQQSNSIFIKSLLRVNGLVENDHQIPKTFEMFNESTGHHEKH